MYVHTIHRKLVCIMYTLIRDFWEHVPWPGLVGKRRGERGAIFSSHLSTSCCQSSLWREEAEEVGGGEREGERGWGSEGGRRAGGRLGWTHFSVHSIFFKIFVVFFVNAILSSARGDSRENARMYVSKWAKETYFRSKRDVLYCRENARMYVLIDVFVTRVE